MLLSLRAACRQPTLGLGVALVALFVALGGTSVAADATKSAVKLITGKQIKNSSIASVDVKNNSLTGSDVKNGSLLSDDFMPGQLPAGPSGPQGAKGDKGDTGDTGPAGPVALKYVFGTAKPILASSTSNDQVDCPAGWSVAGGGLDTNSASAQVSTQETFPADGPDADSVNDDGWVGEVSNSGATTGWTFTVWAACTQATQVTEQVE